MNIMVRKPTCERAALFLTWCTPGTARQEINRLSVPGVHRVGNSVRIFYVIGFLLEFHSRSSNIYSEEWAICTISHSSYSAECDPVHRIIHIDQF